MRLSSRIPASLEPNGLARILSKRRAAGLSVLDLTESNPTRCGFSYPEAAIRAALGDPATLAYAPDPRGAPGARAAIAASLGNGVDPGDLVLTASTSEAYAWIFKLLADPGDDVLVPSPAYPLFTWLAALEGLETRRVPAFRFEGWHLDFEGLARACGARTRALLVVNPNNPTGHYLKREEWKRLTEFCAERSLVLVVDEVFADFPLEPPEAPMGTVLEDPSPPCPTLVLSGLSKGALLPQVKLGWIVARGPGRERILDRLEFIADQFLSPSASAQAAAPEILRLAPDLRGQALRRLRNNLVRLDRALLPHPAWSRLPVEGGWSVVLRGPGLLEDEALAEGLLESRGVLVHPGSFFGFPDRGYLVVSLLPPESDFESGLGLLLESYGRG
ncbi:MAG: pyridoxal phosphate-dependent aminotransferase [Acidobacteria bacterium]|nr:pyridoxal phosphate-dependent aminotransferase [Acidobacteriota bacterium]